MTTIINNPGERPVVSGEAEGLSTGVLVGIILVIVIVLLLIFGLPAWRGDNTDTDVDINPAPAGGGPTTPVPDNTPTTNIEGDVDVNLY